MKYFRIIYILFISMMVLFSSCNKNETEDEVEEEEMVIEEEEPDVYIYDGCIPLTRKVKSFATQEVHQEFTFEYENGRLILIKNSWGYEEVYSYDEGRVSEITCYNSQNKISRYAKYDYDQNNRIVSQQYFEESSDSLKLVYDINYIYEEGVLTSADISNLGKRVLIFNNNESMVIDSILTIDSNNKKEELITYEWDNKHHPNKNLKIPILGYTIPPIPSDNNLKELVSYVFDQEGNKVESGSNTLKVLKFNEFDFPLEIQRGQADLFEMVYTNCN